MRLRLPWFLEATGGAWRAPTCRARAPSARWCKAVYLARHGATWTGHRRENLQQVNARIQQNASSALTVRASTGDYVAHPGAGLGHPLRAGQGALPDHIPLVGVISPVRSSHARSRI